MGLGWFAVQACFIANGMTSNVTTEEVFDSFFYPDAIVPF